MLANLIYIRYRVHCILYHLSKKLHELEQCNAIVGKGVKLILFSLLILAMSVIHYSLVVWRCM